jgi:hypothetical protein
MTKDTYFEMCELLGNTPITSEIPVDFDDFPLEVQQAFTVYRMLRDDWEGFGGNYLGKSFVGLIEILDFAEIDQEDRKLILLIIKMIDNIRIDELVKKRKNEKPAD